MPCHAKITPSPCPKQFHRVARVQVALCKLDEGVGKGGDVGCNAGKITTGNKAESHNSHKSDEIGKSCALDVCAIIHLITGCALEL